MTPTPLPPPSPGPIPDRAGSVSPVDAGFPPAIGGLFNFRDAAACSPSTTFPALSRGLLFRSGALNGLDCDAWKVLDRRGINTVIDLREPAEAAAAPDNAPAGIKVISAPVYRGRIPRDLPLSELYQYLLQDCGQALADAVRQVIRHLHRGVLVHCAAGKDRTGLVIALLLSAVGADREAVIRDYARSADMLPERFRDASRARLQALIADPAALDTALHLHLASPAGAMRAALWTLEGESLGGYTGAGAYLLRHGLSREDLDLAAEMLLDRSVSAGEMAAVRASGPAAVPAS